MSVEIFYSIYLGETNSGKKCGVCVRVRVRVRVHVRVRVCVCVCVCVSNKAAGALEQARYLNT